MRSLAIVLQCGSYLYVYICKILPFAMKMLIYLFGAKNEYIGRKNKIGRHSFPGRSGLSNVLFPVRQVEKFGLFCSFYCNRLDEVM